jgi:hypothetical protein
MLTQVLHHDADGIRTTSTGSVPEVSDFTAAAVEGVNYTTYIADGALTKGDLVYFTVGKVKKYSVLTEKHFAVGIANETVADAAPVKVLKNEEVCTGILVGATVDTRFYWTGTGWDVAKPVGTGKYLWTGGYAKNATDLFINVELTEKNG